MRAKLLKSEQLKLYKVSIHFLNIISTFQISKKGLKRAKDELLKAFAQVVVLPNIETGVNK